MRQNKEYYATYKRRYFVATKVYLIDLKGGRCEAPNCKITDPNLLEFAHIKETPLKGEGRGTWRRLTDWILYFDCYKVLCQSHHDKLDGVWRQNRRDRCFGAD